MVISTIAEHLEKLRYFVAIAEEGTMVKAAEKFRTSQPTLSHSMRVLEDVLGVRLFDRSSNGVTLTRSGNRLYHFAKSTLDSALQIEHSLRLTDEMEKASVTVGTKEPYAISQWPNYVALLQLTFPHLDLSLSVDRSNKTLIRSLREEKLDLIMIPDPPEVEGVTAYELFQDRFFLYLSKKNYERTPLDKILLLPIYLFRAALTGGTKTIGNALKTERDLIKRARDVDSFNVARSFALKGLGLALLAESMVQDDIASGALVKLDLPALKLPPLGSLKVCLCVLDKNRENRHLVAIRKQLRQFHRLPA